MKKKLISMALCAGLAVSLLTGCGGSADNESTEAEKQETQEETADDAEAAGVETEEGAEAAGTDAEENAEVAETETEEDAEAAGEEASAELNEYGLTDAQQEALLASVKESVTEEYLKKYDIPVSEFQLLPYDVYDLGNYDESGNYSGTDSYECASMWRTIDNVIGGADNLTFNLLIGTSAGYKEMAVEEVLKSGFSLEDTLEEQNQKNKDNNSTGGYYVFDTSSEFYNFANAVYMGIAKYLNGLAEQERVDLLYNLYEISYNNGEYVPVEGVLGDKSTTTMFDKVISDNIQFE